MQESAKLDVLSDLHPRISWAAAQKSMPLPDMQKIEIALSYLRRLPEVPDRSTDLAHSYSYRAPSQGLDPSDCLCVKGVLLRWRHGC